MSEQPLPVLGVVLGDGTAMTAKELLDQFPCVCDPAYYERNLEDPQCVHHDLARTLRIPEDSPHGKHS